MSRDWDLIPLKEILIKSDEWIDIKPESRYKQVTVKIWGKGVVERNEVTGSEIAAAKRLLVRSGQFILSRIDARHGAFGLIPDSLDGAVVTNDFPVFTPNHQRVLPQFLDWISKTGNFVEICKAASEGTTNRVRLKEDKFLAMKILLPPLEEQWRIVARVEELAGKIEEARSLRQKAAKESEILLSNYSSVLFEDIGKREGLQDLGNIAIKVTDGEHATPRRCEFGHYLLSARNIQNNKIDLTTVDYVDKDEFIRIKKRCDPSVGDVLISCSGSIGKVAIVNKSDTYVMVRSVAMVRPDQKILNSEYLAHVLRSRMLQTQMTEKAKATAQANLFLGKIKSLKLPVPPLPEQYRIVAYLDDFQAKIDEMKRLREQAIAELDAVLPSILDKAFKGEL